MLTFFKRMRSSNTPYKPMNVTIIDIDNESHLIKYKRFEYPNLMELIVNTYYSEIGECKGKGLCGTCVLELVYGKFTNTLSKQEQHTLLVHKKGGKGFRLACQIVLDKNLDGLTFKVITV